MGSDPQNRESGELVGWAGTLLPASVGEPTFGANGPDELRRALANARDRKVWRDWQPYVWEGAPRRWWGR